MATYTAEQLGIKAPSGGFEKLGWYPSTKGGSFQYYEGTFGESGAIHPNSPQVGAGQAVSKEVVAQTNPANVPYLASYKPGGYPNSTEEVSPYLNNIQNSAYDAFSNAPEVKVQTMDEIKGIVTPEGGAPSAISRVEKFEELKLSQGVADLETTLNDLKAQEDDLNAAFRQQKTAERGKTVPMNVIEGRISEEERTYLEQQDYLGRQKSRVIDELNTKYNGINMYMNYYGLDYQDAVDKYDKEFDRNLSMYSIVLDQEKLKVDQWYKDQAIATTNLQMYMNAITAGNMNYSSLSGEQKMMISKLEAQSGMPQGFVSGLQIAPQDTIMSFSGDKTQMMVLGSDGNFKVVQTGMSKATSGGADELSSSQINAAKQKVIQLGGSDSDLERVAKDIDFYNWVMAQDTTKKTTGLSNE